MYVDNNNKMEIFIPKKRIQIDAQVPDFLNGTLNEYRKMYSGKKRRSLSVGNGACICTESLLGI